MIKGRQTLLVFAIPWTQNVKAQTISQLEMVCVLRNDSKFAFMNWDYSKY